MVLISRLRRKQLLDNFKDRKIIVVGDMMLDRYLWGSTSRISPEAPVPVVEIESEANRLGGAANVIHNLSTLGAIPIAVGVIGDDDAGEMLMHQLCQMHFMNDGIIRDPSRVTSVKTRIIAHNQHVVRADKESKERISDKIAKQLIAKIQEFISDCEAIIFEDYNKGLLTAEVIRHIIRLALKANVISTVDPKVENFFEYQHVTLFKPNRRETEIALGVKLLEEEDIRIAGTLLRDRLSCDSVLITLGEKGMCLMEKSGELTISPTKAQKVHDVSGAGDTVISTVTLALVAGATVKEATTLANYAAGVVCSEVGVVPIHLKRLKQALNEDEQ